MAIQRGYRWFFSSGNQFAQNIIIPFIGTGAPVDGTSGTGVGLAGKGSKYIDYATGNWYTNTGTKASPTWIGDGSTAGAATPTSVVSSGLIKSTSPTAGIGYATGAGGTVTQGTSRTTAVVLNTVSGNIVLFSAAGSATAFSFTLTNSAIAAGDTVILNQKSGTDKYTTQVVTAVAAGSCQITLANASGTTTEQPVFNFNVIKGVAS